MALVQGALSSALGSTLIARILATAQDAPIVGGAFATVALKLGAINGPIGGGAALDAIGARNPIAVSAGLALVAVLAWLAIGITSRLRRTAAGSARETAA